MEVVWTRSARTKEVKVVITEDLDSSSHQRLIALPVNFFPFSLHPSTAIHQVTEYVYERLLNDDLCAYHRLGVPSKVGETSVTFSTCE